MTPDLDKAAPNVKIEGDGAPEIEITEEMIEAGAAFLRGCDRRVWDEESMAEAIFLAMLEKSEPPTPPTLGQVRCIETVTWRWEELLPLLAEIGLAPQALEAPTAHPWRGY